MSVYKQQFQLLSRAENNEQKSVKRQKMAAIALFELIFFSNL
jgi:hypothetical protein